MSRTDWCREMVVANPFSSPCSQSTKIPPGTGRVEGYWGKKKDEEGELSSD